MNEQTIVVEDTTLKLSYDLLEESNELKLSILTHKENIAETGKMDLHTFKYPLLLARERRQSRISSDIQKVIATIA